MKSAFYERGNGLGYIGVGYVVMLALQFITCHKIKLVNQVVINMRSRYLKEKNIHVS
ncbi:hypothetical protein JCM10914A_49690 [Paenibacillus sp. JCM 10914]|uniref:hypothetical protein n=1 Tax=Paenibacillus sp. JCM 10914 TaxID=1236974 RepID=UPI0003CC3C8A|nr:hypothetical protein [Paenibacillus sp. JCM 10914]GAE08903.1 hypothetical protein JCM10914_5239 [Paenibacillus sp. JCM 10914]